VELPVEVEAAVERLERAEAELAAVPRPVEVKTASTLMAEGTALAKAQAEAARMAEKAAVVAEAGKLAKDARDGARFNLNRVMAAHRDELVLGIRPLVRAVIDKARPYAERLARFAPGYAPGDVVRHGDADDLAAWQAAQEVEKEFGILMAAWRGSFQGEASRPGARVDVREVDQAHHFWARPELVALDALNGTRLNRSGHPVRIQPGVLSVAAESPEAGFRLATLGELRAIFDAEHPQARRPGDGRKTLGARFV
jgi:hypothetical protein